MCLNLKEQFKRRIDAREFIKTPRISGRAIKVYKLLCLDDNGDIMKYHSPYRSVLYKPSEEKKTQKFSFTIVDACGWRIHVNQGIHSYKTKELALAIATKPENKRTYVVVECTIPKGTSYFKNDHEYVSLQLNMPDLEFNVEKIKKQIILTPNKEWIFLDEFSLTPEWEKILLEDFK